MKTILSSREPEFEKIDHRDIDKMHNCQMCYYWDGINSYFSQAIHNKQRVKEAKMYPVFATSKFRIRYKIQGY